MNNSPSSRPNQSLTNPNPILQSQGAFSQTPIQYLSRKILSRGEASTSSPPRSTYLVRIPLLEFWQLLTWALSRELEIHPVEYSWISILWDPIDPLTELNYPNNDTSSFHTDPPQRIDKPTPDIDTSPQSREPPSPPESPPTTPHSSQ